MITPSPPLRVWYYKFSLLHDLDSSWAVSGSEWYLLWVTVSPCKSVYNILCMKAKNKTKKKKSASIAHWGSSSISISQAPLPGVKDCKKKRKKKTKRKTLTHPYKHTCTLHLPTFVHIYTQRDTTFSQKKTRPHWQAYTHARAHTQLHKHPRSLAAKRQKSEWESRHLDEQITV